MTVKELKERIQNFPDDAKVVIEGRWGESFDTHEIELTELPGYQTKVAYLT